MDGYPNWRRLIERHLIDASADPTSAYCQLATVDAQGNPNVRTMVYRGFDEVDHGILMCTDFASDKCQQLDHDSKAQIVWYLSKARTQYRLTGATEVYTMTCPETVDRDQNYTPSANSTANLRSVIWGKLSANAKKSFIENLISYELDSSLLEQSDIEKEPPPNNFAVIKLSPVWVESLNLRSNPHKRTRWRLSDSKWIDC